MGALLTLLKSTFVRELRAKHNAKALAPESDTPLLERSKVTKRLDKLVLSAATPASLRSSSAAFR